MATTGLLGIGALLGVAAATGTCGWALGRRCPPDSPHRSDNRALASVVVLGLGGTFLGLRLAGIDVLGAVPAAESVRSAMGPAFVLEFLAASVVAVPTIVVGLGAYRSARPDATTVASDVVPAGLLQALALVAAIAVFAAVARWGLVLAIPAVLVLFVAGAAAKWLVWRTQLQSRPLATEAPDLVDRVVEATGVDPGRLRVVEGSEDAWRPFAHGAGPLKRVHLPRHLLERDDDTVFVSLVHLSVPSAFKLYRLVAWGLWAGALLTALIAANRASDPLLTVVGPIAVILGPIPLVAVGRGLVYRGDDRAGEIVGRDALASTFASQAEDVDVGGVARVLRIVLMVPPVRKRIERLRS